MLNSDLILVRHGENEIDFNKENRLLTLSEEGIKQAKKVRDILEGKIDVVISSTSLRSMLTALLIAPDKNIICDNNLLECGWGNKMHDGSETDLESFIRVKTVFEKYINLYPDKRILMVFHGSLMKLAQNYIENKSFDYERDSVDNCDTIFYSKEGTKKYIKVAEQTAFKKNSH